MTLSYSDTDTYGRCPKAFYYRVVKDIQRKTTLVELKLGTLVHSALRYIFAGETIEMAHLYLSAEVADNPVLFEDEKAEQQALVDDACRIVEGYLPFMDPNWEVLHAEESFTTDIHIYSEDYHKEPFSFTPDLIVRDEFGNVWVVDHKTTSDKAPKEMPQADLQALAYYAGIKDIYPELAGFIFNYLRKKVPAEPRLALTGKKRIAYLSTIDTTAEILRDAMEEFDLMDDLDHRQRLAELQDHNTFYFQQKVYITEEQAAAVLEDVGGKLSMIKWSDTTGIYPRTMVSSGMRSCSRCSYNQICFGEMLGEDTDMILSEYYEKRDHRDRTEQRTGVQEVLHEQEEQSA